MQGSDRQGQASPVSQRLVKTVRSLPLDVPMRERLLNEVRVDGQELVVEVSERDWLSLDRNLDSFYSAVMKVSCEALSIECN